MNEVSGTVVSPLASMRALGTGLILVGSVGLAGCTTLAPSYVAPDIDLPPSTAAAPMSIDRQWWRAYDDPVLNRLVDEALANNLDLAKAVANIEEARASARGAQSLLSPRLDAALGGAVSKRQLTIGSEDINTTTAYGAGGLGASWEVDLWGRIRASNDAALARLSASEHTRNAVGLSISAAVAETYFQLLALDAKLRITEGARTGLKQITELELRRWKGGMGTEYAYQQSLAELVAIEARMPDLDGAIARTELALEVLVGRSPRQIGTGVPRDGTMPNPPVAPREFDTALLMRRPDVASAEQMLVAADADVNAIRAEKRPRLNLSMLGGLIAVSSGAITGFPLYFDLSAGLAAPIYDAGLIQSRIDGAEARKEQAVAHYRYTVSVAFREIHDAMVLLETGDRQFIASQRVVEVRERSRELSERSYAAGRSTKYEVLGETIKVLDAQLAVADARQNQLLARSQYFKALGGGF